MRPSCDLNWQFRFSNNHKLHYSYPRLSRDRCHVGKTQSDLLLSWKVFWVVMRNSRIIGSRTFKETNRFQESLNPSNKYRNNEQNNTIAAYYKNCYPPQTLGRP
jgi:hypothetical protein